MDIPKEVKQLSDIGQPSNGLLSKCSTSIMEITPTTDHKAAVWSEPDAVLERWLTTHELENVLAALRVKRQKANLAHEGWSLKQWLYRTNKRVWKEFLHSRCHLFTHGV